MSIVSSVIVEDSPQRDTRRHVCERHTDHLGRWHFVRYIAAAGANITTVMNARVASIDALLVNAELQENVARAMGWGAYVNGMVSPTTQFCTNAQIRNILREMSFTLKGIELCRLAAYISFLNPTDNQLKTMYSVDDAGLVIVKQKIASRKAKYDATLTEIGD